MAYDLVARLKLIDRLSAPMERVKASIKRTQAATDAAKSSLNRYGDQMRQASSATKVVEASTRRLAASIVGIAGAYASAKTAAKAFQATIGAAANAEMQQVTIEAMFKGETKKANEFFEFIQKKSAESIFTDIDFLGSSKSFVAMTKNMDQLKGLVNIAERMAILDPAQGLEGAAVALRELASGDIQSIVERFEMPRQLANAVKNASLDEQLKALDLYLNNLGITTQLIAKQGQTSLGMYNKAIDKVKFGLRSMGKDGLERIKPLLAQVNAYLDSPAWQNAINAGSTFLSKVVGELIVKLNQLVAWTSQNGPKLQAVWKDVKAAALPIGTAISTATDAAKNFAQFVLDNWPAVRESIIGIGAAVGTAYAAFKAMTIVETATTLIRAYRAGTLSATAAQMGLNLAMLSSPFTWVVGGISLLIGAGVMLYRNWDVVKEKLGSAWDYLHEKALIVFQAIRQVIESSMGAVTKAINAGITVVNKVPGLKLPKIGGNGDENSAKTSGSRAVGLRQVPYDGVYKLHKDEQVLTAPEARDYREGRTSGGANPVFNITINVNGTGSTEKDAEKIVGIIVRKLANYQATGTVGVIGANG